MAIDAAAEGRRLEASQRGPPKHGRSDGIPGHLSGYLAPAGLSRRQPRSETGAQLGAARVFGHPGPALTAGPSFPDLFFPERFFYCVSCRRLYAVRQRSKSMSVFIGLL